MASKSLAKRVSDLMDWDATKTLEWFMAPNPMLGGCTPEEMIHAGRIERLERFIAEAEEANVSREEPR